MAVVFNGTGDATVILDYDNYRVGNCSARSIGNNAYLNIKIPGEDITLSNNFTIEGWFYFDSAWATWEMFAPKTFVEINGDPSTIVESQDGVNFSSDDPDFWIGYNNDQGSLFTPDPVLQVGFKEVDSEADHRLYYHWEIPTEQWIHIAVVRNNNQIRLYIDGNEVTTAQYSGNSSLSYIPVNEGIEYSPSSLYDQYPNAAPYAFDTNVKIGLDYHGNFDEFRIRNGAVYTSNFTPSTTPFEPSLISDILLLHFDGNFDDDIYNVKAASELTAAFTANISAINLVSDELALSASTETTVQEQLTLGATVIVDAEFAQTTAAGNIIRLVYPFNWFTHPTWDEWLIWQNTFNLPGTFTQTAESDLVELHLAELSVSAEFTTSTDSTVGRTGTIDVASNFESHVSLNGVIPADTDINTVFAITVDTQVLCAAELDLTSASEFSAAINGSRLGDIDVSATTTLSVDTTVEHVGIVEAAAEFTMVSDLGLVINAELDVMAEFTTEIDLLVKYGSPIQLNTAFNKIVNAGILLSAAAEFAAETAQSTLVDLTVGADVSASAEFAADITPRLMMVGAAEWTALTAIAVVGFSEAPDPCRTLSIQAETRTITVSAETRTLNIRTCSLRRAA